MPPTVTRRRLLGLSASAVGLAIAGCLERPSSASRADESDATGELGEPAETVEVRVVSVPNVAFEPGIVHVVPGGTVRWVVEGHRHDVTAYHPETDGPQRIPDGAQPWASGLLRGGREFERTFETEGVYDYVDTRALCASHEALGAVGRVVVGWPDPADEPALTHDGSELPGRAATVTRQYDEQTLAALERPRRT
ncbi:plastocyanin/azurin family copper-binding protein [Natronobiforma cellulositropha]|uniref:plastocyanin/azurin family copper-binding protein n=1 Tax=Natronobiforma cellulositropha TaxID=1679076 RepID=UPI0021D5750A|nr:plastocyanin/azurin family copper-binding protein [Natronobiforma cellulositropha]